MAYDEYEAPDKLFRTRDGKWVTSELAATAWTLEELETQLPLAVAAKDGVASWIDVLD